MGEHVQPLEGLDINETDALLAVDLQHDFMPGGALAATDGDRIVPGVNALASQFSTVVYTRDWHPPGHKSFASVYKGKKPMDPIEAPGLGPVLWPDHCVCGTWGAQFHPDLDIRPATLILHKGTNPEIDSYSAFLENDKETETGLDGYMKNRGIVRIFVCGLVLDFCDFFTAMDGLNKGFEVGVVLDLSPPLDIPKGNKTHVIKSMLDAGIKLFFSDPSRVFFNKWYGDIDAFQP